MTLSIEVLPAPFGPMMARTSPFLMSNDTSRIATTPPNDSDTRSTDSNTSARSFAAGLVMARCSRLSFRPRISCCLPDRRRDRNGLGIPDLDTRRQDALAAILEGDLGGDVGLARAVVQRLDQR